MFDWMTDTMAAGGYPGLAFLMLIENVFPPIPSEVVMSLGGFLAAQGRLSLPLVIVVGTIGSVAGATFWYYIGLWVGRDRLRAWAERHGYWLTISGEDVDRVDAWFGRKGHWAVLIGRFLPGFRTLISVPAGIARMPLGRFLLYSTVGSLFWISGLAVFGYVVESQYDRISGWVDPVGWALLAAMVGVYVLRLVRQLRR